MKMAIKMNSSEYKIIQNNLYKLKNKLYNISMHNVIRTIESNTKN